MKILLLATAQKPNSVGKRGAFIRRNCVAKFAGRDGKYPEQAVAGRRIANSYYTSIELPEGGGFFPVLLESRNFPQLIKMGCLMMPMVRATVT